MSASDIIVIDVSAGTGDPVFATDAAFKSSADSRRVEMLSFMSKLGVAQMRTQLSDSNNKVYRILVTLAKAS